MKKRVLILGSSGMLGHVLYYYLTEQEKYNIVDISHRQKLSEKTILLDIQNEEKTSSVIKEIKPDVIVNCIGILIKESNSNPSRAIYINSYFPHYLSSICQEIDARLIHISTDCVFSGKRGGYVETDFRDADDYYGRSKALGELNNERDLTIRTSIIGPELKTNGEGLFDWFSKQEGVVNGFTNAFWTGVTTLELALQIDLILNKNISNIIHVVPNSKISKYNLLKEIDSVFNLNKKIIPYEFKKIDKSLIDSRKNTSTHVKGYREMLVELKNFMLEHQFLYSKYK